MKDSRFSVTPTLGISSMIPVTPRGPDGSIPRRGVWVEVATYDDRINLADATRRAARALKRGARLALAVDSDSALRTGNRHYRLVTVLVEDGKVIERYRYRRDGRVSGVPYGTRDLLVVDGPATRETGEEAMTVNDEVLARYDAERIARAAADAEAARAEWAARTQAEFAARGRALRLSGYKGRMFEMPDGTYSVQLGNDPDAPLQTVCCWNQGVRVIDNRVRGNMPEHVEGCPGGTSP